MQGFRAYKSKLQALLRDKRSQNEGRRVLRSGRAILFSLFRLVIVVGVSYVILSPLIGILASSFFSNADRYSPLVYVIPMEPTLERYSLAILRMDYWNVLRNLLLYDVSLMLIQVAVCSMVGYGFARFRFPFKRLLFACVIVMIVIPTHTVMLSLYTTFRNFNPLGLVGLFNGGQPLNLLSGVWPVYIMTLFGCGLRSGLYIYLFNQFFRGLPKEIEEAAMVDGCGMARTYVRVMLPNALPSIVTVAIFALVWQYNDTFFANLFNISGNVALSKRITTLQATISNIDQVLDPNISTLYVYAGIILMILPVIVLYILLQRQFIEGVERSGIVG